ncbi:unnamed protein product [Bubo scandiacus]
MLLLRAVTGRSSALPAGSRRCRCPRRASSRFPPGSPAAGGPRGAAPVLAALLGLGAVLAYGERRRRCGPGPPRPPLPPVHAGGGGAAPLPPGPRLGDPRHRGLRRHRLRGAAPRGGRQAAAGGRGAPGALLGPLRRPQPAPRPGAAAGVQGGGAEPRGGAAGPRRHPGPLRRGTPPRHPALRVNSQKPFNAEPPAELLAERFLTPNELFFTRNHLPVPAVDPSSYRLRVEGPGGRALSLSLAELRSRFPKHEVTATLQCAGNRRTEMSRVRPVKGLAWDIGAISTARWGGARLRDVLLHAGFAEEREGEWHVCFEGLDTDVGGGSLRRFHPLRPRPQPGRRRAAGLRDERRGAAPRPRLPPARGGARRGGRPQRQVGAARGREPGREPQPLAAQRLQGLLPLRGLGHGGLHDGARHPGAAGAVGHHPPAPRRGGAGGGADGEGLRLERRRAGGGAGRRLAGRRPDLARGAAGGASGRRWGAPGPGCCGSWRRRVTAGAELEIVCKAVDGSYNVQPDTVAPIWNLRGVLSNAWHRVRVTVSR